jgi:hypothetical protein
LFQGNSLDDTPENSSHDQIINASYPLNFSFNPIGTPSVVFKQLSGDVASAVTITISDNYHHTSVITINTEGRISWTN